MGWLDRTPLFAVYGAFFVILLVGVEVGYRGFHWIGPTEGPRIKGQEFLLSAVLGLLALLVGFTFSMSLSRYDERRALVVQEANAIGRSWLTAQLLDEPYRGELSGLLKQYADVRLVWSEGSNVSLGPTHALQQRIWATVQQLPHSGTMPEIVQEVLDPLGQAFEVQATRTAVRAGHIPTEVLASLVAYSAVSMVMLGYILALNGHRQAVATGLLMLLLTLAFALIVELDTPRTGSILVSQQPLADLKASLR